MILPPPLLGFAAFSGVGKTTLLKRLIPLLTAQGLRLGLIKHSHHAFTIDRPGKDSAVLAQAGAVQTVVVSSRRSVLLAQHADKQDFSLPALLSQMAVPSLDLILVEGCKYQPLPKIELHRPSLGHPLLCQHDTHIRAIATDAPLPVAVAVPQLDLNDPPALAAFILALLPELRTRHDG